MADPEVEPLVSIAVVTYNHEQYIGECLESIIKQEVPGKVQIVVGEDASTDRTREIVSGFAQREPQCIDAILNAENIGGWRNFVNVLRACRGRYVAILDGDDKMYPGKLKAQIAVLESSPDCAIVAHKLDVFDESTGKKVSIFDDASVRPVSTFEDLVKKGTYFGNSSVMYRRSYLDVDLFERLHPRGVVGDWLLHLIVARHGKIVFIDEVLGAYRRHGQGTTARGDLEAQRFADNQQILQRAVELGASESAFKEGSARICYLQARKSLERGDFETYRALIEESRRSYHLEGTVQWLYYAFRHAPRLLMALRGLRKTVVPGGKR
jgi:glycosyltransferase involved in cell wall biosynthesis